MCIGRMPCAYDVRDWADVSTNQGIPEVASKYKEVGERNGIDSTLQNSEETNSDNTDLRLLAYKTVSNTFLSHEPPNLWYFLL